MSQITDMVIITGMNEEGAIKGVNKWFYKNDKERHQQFEIIDMKEAGGTKEFCTEVYAMAGNHIVHEEFIEIFPNFAWEYPAEVTLIVSFENDAFIRVFRADGRTLEGDY